LTMPWHKKDFSDLVPGTKYESLGYLLVYTGMCRIRYYVQNHISLAQQSVNRRFKASTY